MIRVPSLLHRSHPLASRVGVALALGTALISGVAVYLNAQAVHLVGDPVVYTTLKNGVAALILLGLAFGSLRGASSGRAVPSGGRARLGLLALGVVGGSLPFVLFFTGLAEASAPAAAVIHKTLFVWVALLAVVLLRERLGGLQLAALGVLLVAQLAIQPPDGVAPGGGELLIALATGCWAIEAVLAGRLLSGVRSPTAAAARMGIGLLLLTAWLAVSGQLGAVWTLGAGAWAWIVGTGILLAAYVATWYAALARAPATVVAAVLTVGAPITALLQLTVGGQLPEGGAAIGYGLVLAAAAAIGLSVWRRTTVTTARPGALAG